MIRELATGAAAGLLGAAALNLVTYGDMAVRGRPASDLPTQVASGLADKAHIDLRWEGEPNDKKENREEAVGALLGLVSGVAIGAAYGPLRERLPDKAVPLAGFGLGLVAMAAGNGPQVALGLTDPKKWGKEGWIADVVPHMVYGFATAGALEAMRNGRAEPVMEVGRLKDKARTKLTA